MKRFVTLGAGYWTQYQLAGWQELPNAPRCVGICNRSVEKARALADRFGIPHVCDDPKTLIEQTKPDFVDVVTSVSQHADNVRLALDLGIPVICQKPLTTNYATAKALVEEAKSKGGWLGVHENWRFQPQIREVRRVIERGLIGTPFRARIQFSTSFPVYEYQPQSATAERFIVMDIGSHILDTARFLFGEAETLLCHTDHINPRIAGEDVATVMMQMSRCPTVICEMSYASRMRNERFPETYITVEGTNGSVELRKDAWVHVTTAAGTDSYQSLSPSYSWADPRWNGVHSSIVECNGSLYRAMDARGPAETSGADNLKTVALVWASYRSAEQRQTITLADFEAA